MKKLSNIANNYARRVDALIMQFFRFKNLIPDNKTFKKLKRVTIKGERVDYYFKKVLIISIYPYDKTTLSMDYKLHFLKSGDDKC